MSAPIFTNVIATSKIPILVLIQAYCHKEFRPRSIPPILSTLVELIEGGQELQQRLDCTIIPAFFPPLSLIIDTFRTSIVSFFEDSDTVTPAMALEDAKKVEQCLLSGLWRIRDLDDFYSLLKSGSKLLVEKPDIYDPAQPVRHISYSSYLGRFVFSITIASEALLFEETTKLWNAFVVYREESAALWKTLQGGVPKIVESRAERRERAFEQALTDNLDLPENTVDTDIKVYSKVDVAQLLEFQVQKLQTYAGTIPDSLRQVLASMSESQRSAIPSSYYVEYLEYWKKGDYEGSFNSLHRYFDYMMSNKQRLFYHYALLSLATLHASFGSDDEALRAIDEAILVARENKDLDCLNYLLTWLFDFLKNRPQLSRRLSSAPGREQILQFLKLKTRESKSCVLQSMAYQYEAVKQMLEGFPLRKVLNNITRAFFILLDLDPNANTKPSFAKACELAVTVWARAGVPSMARLYISAAEATGTELAFADEVELALRKSEIAYRGGDPTPALSLIEKFKDQVSGETAYMKEWQTRCFLLKGEMWLKQGRYKQVEILLTQLESQVSEIHNSSLKCEVDYALACYYDKVGNTIDAVKVISRQQALLTSDEFTSDNFWAIKFEILNARVISTHSSAPERALSMLFNALEMAHRSSLLPLIVEGALILCELLLRIDPENSISDVADILESGMPHILQIEDLTLSSQAYYLLAKVATGESLQTDITCLDKAIKYSNKAVEGFQKMADYEWLRKSLELQTSFAKFSKQTSLAKRCQIMTSELDSEIRRSAKCDL